MHQHQQTLRAARKRFDALKKQHKQLARQVGWETEPEFSRDMNMEDVVDIEQVCTNFVSLISQVSTEIARREHKDGSTVAVLAEDFSDSQEQGNGMSIFAPTPEDALEPYSSGIDDETASPTVRMTSAEQATLAATVTPELSAAPPVNLQSVQAPPVQAPRMWSMAGSFRCCIHHWRAVLATHVGCGPDRYVRAGSGDLRASNLAARHQRCPAAYADGAGVPSR